MTTATEVREHSDALKWIVSRDTGLSSRTIWGVMMGVDCEWPSLPYDPADFGRCYRLLMLMPSWRERLPDVATRYPEWGPLVAAWSELEQMYLAALEAGERHSPEMYHFMQGLVAEGESTKQEQRGGSVLSTVVARKEHLCDLCATPIAQGSAHDHMRMTPWTSGDLLSGFYSYRIHLEPCLRVLYASEAESDGLYYMPGPADFRRDYLTAADRALLQIESSEEGQRDGEGK